MVSGILKYVKRINRMALKAKIQKVVAPPAFSNKTGVNCVISTTPIHRVKVAKDMAIPRVLVGNISEMITQGIGPRDEAKLAMNPSIKRRSRKPEFKLK